MLTDAQRVSPGPNAGNSQKSLEDKIAELEAAVSERGGDFEPDGSEDQAQHRPDKIVYTRPASEKDDVQEHRGAFRLSQIMLLGTDEFAHADEDGDDDDETVTAVPRFRHRTTPGKNKDASEADEAPMAEDVAPDQQRSGEIAAFIRPEDVIDRIEARLGRSATSEDAGPSFAIPFPSRRTVSERTEKAETPVPEQVKPVDTDQPSDMDDESEVAFEAALSDAVSAAPPEEGAEADAEPPAEDRAVSAEEATAEAATGEPAVPPGDAALEDILDEELLRPIIAKLVREEFQGELGERITRSIRKLVRREILRALSSKSVE